MTATKCVCAVVTAIFAIQVTPLSADTVLFTAGVDTSSGTNPVSVPPTANPHIPPISPGVILTPSPPINLDGMATGPLNGNFFGPGAYPGGTSTGGTTGWVNVSYTIVTPGLTPFFVEVANVGDSAFDSGLAIDNIRINGSTYESFESGLPAWTFDGFQTISGPVVNLAPTDGLFFLFLDTTGSASAIFDTIDGTNAGNFLTPNINFLAGDVLSFDIAFMTTDGTATFHDYGLAALGIPQVVPEPSSALLAVIGCLGAIGRSTKHRAARAKT